MLKDQLKELYEVLSLLNNSGYFNVSIPEPSVPANEPSRARNPRGPDISVREKGRKLTRQEALDIYNEDRYSLPELAEIFTVHVSTVYDIKSGRTWRRATGHKNTNPLLKARQTDNGKKLTVRDALDIYKDTTLSSAELAEIYGVSAVSILNVKAGRTWAHITGHKK
jgi:predicted DNA-binding protein YlxM (UPF0122 family)